METIHHLSPEWGWGWRIFIDFNCHSSAEYEKETIYHLLIADAINGFIRILQSHMGWSGKFYRDET